MDENVTHKVVMYFAWLGTQGSNPVLLSGCQQHIATCTASREPKKHLCMLLVRSLALPP